MLAKCDKTRGHKENSIMSSIYILLFQSTLYDIVLNQLTVMPTTLMAQDLDSVSTNNLTHPEAQCACVLHHKTYIKHLRY